MIEYVVGYLFDFSNNVVLIRKTKPAWQAGKMNGIGGKVEPGENALQAMIREFKEETGADFTDWEKFIELSEEGYKLHSYRGITNDVHYLGIQTTTDEVVEIVDWTNMTDEVLIEAKWQILMATCALDGMNIKAGSDLWSQDRY